MVNKKLLRIKKQKWRLRGRNRWGSNAKTNKKYCDSGKNNDITVKENGKVEICKEF